MQQAVLTPKLQTCPDEEAVLAFLDRTTFAYGDMVRASNGQCLLHPKLARTVVAHFGLWASLVAAPCPAAVPAPHDRAHLSHGHAGAGARAGHAIQVVGRAAGLVVPGAAAVRAPHDRAIPSYSHAGAGAQAG